MFLDYLDVGDLRDWLHEASVHYKAHINAQELELRAINGYLDYVINLAQVEQEQALSVKHADPLYREPSCCEKPACECKETPHE